MAAAILVGFGMVGLSDKEWHSKSESFTNLTALDHYNIEPVLYCNIFGWIVKIGIINFFFFLGPIFKRRPAPGGTEGQIKNEAFQHYGRIH